MAASLSRPDPSSPASVAEAGFSTARRGYQQDEVRSFLTAVAAELGRLQERERQLEAELADARADEPPVIELDDETATQLLGEETLRVLQTARESASQIKIRAEESAARILREANDEANRLRQDAEVEAARKRQDAASDAEAEVALAKQQGREMVNEARAYRERVLADLDRRTKLARQQIEELLHGRDRLLQVFERARLVAVDVTSELKAIEGPDELVNLAPTTGPVPLMVPAERAVEDTEQERVEGASGPDGGPDAVDVEAASDDEAGEEPAVDEGADETDRADAQGDRADTGDTVDEPADVAETDEGVEAGDEVEGDEADEATASRHDANVVSLFRGRAAPADEEASSADEPDVDGIFARLRSEVPSTDETAGSHADEEVADVDAAEAEEVAEPTPFSRRDEAIVPLIVAGARKLKRVLADEQNGVLDTLRQTEPVTSVDALLPDIDEHVGQYVSASTDELLGAAAAGAGELGANDTKTLRRKLDKAGALDEAIALLRTDLVLPLRDRLERAVAEGAGDNEDITKRVRAVYREWKTQHIDDQLDDVFRYAHGGGLSITVEPGTEMIWSIDPNEPACPDCEDNSLAGPVPAGEAYPTGHTAAPAHPGCRCLTVPAPQ